MINVLLSLFIQSAYADDSVLRDLTKFEKNDRAYIEETYKRKRNPEQYKHIDRFIYLDEILESPEELGAVKEGSFVYTLDNKKKFFLDRMIYVRFHKQPDDQGFKYLVNNNGDIIHKVKSEDITSIAPETVMYEPPHSYTPAPEREVIYWDEKLKTKLELGFAFSMMKADFVQDLLNLDSAPTAQMNHVGLNYMADWDWPVRVGIAAYYQYAEFNTDGGISEFSSISFGPLFKSKELYPFKHPMRLNAQVRYSPFGKMDVNVSTGSTSFDFNTTDLLLGVEFPFQNQWGEFVVLLFSHTQWLNLKNQVEIVNIEPSNRPNQALGIGISQVF